VQNFAEETSDKRPLGKPRKRWEDEIMIDYTETGCQVGRWMKLAQNRVQWRALGIGDVQRTGPVSVTQELICMCNKQANVSCEIGRNAFETRE
jgi:hypothetical protein